MSNAAGSVVQLNVPTVSICIPVFNMAPYVEEAIGSALSQTFQDFEIVACDNASTDGSLLVLRRFDDPRLRVVSNGENIGAARNFNRTAELSRAPWIKWLEADDALEVTCLARCLEPVLADPYVDLVSVGRMRVDQRGRPFLREVHRHSEVVSARSVRARVLLRHNELGTPSEVLVRRELFMSVGGFDSGYGGYLNDWDVWLKCLESARKVAFVAEPLARVRTHPSQIGSRGSRSNEDLDVLYATLRKRWCGRPLSLRWWQRKYLEVALTIPFVYRGLGQATQWRQHGSAGRWDAFARSTRNLGALQVGVTVLIAALVAPIWPWYARSVTNATSVGPAWVTPLKERGSFAFVAEGAYLAFLSLVLRFIVRALWP